MDGINAWRDVILRSLQDIVHDTIQIAPKAIAALVLLALGWIVARLFQAAVSRLLHRVGFDGLAERAGITALIANSGFHRASSWIVGRLLFWFLMLMFFLAAANQLEFHAIVSTLQDFVRYIPNLIAVVLISVFGAVFGRFVGGLVRGWAREGGIEFADLLGKLVTNAILIMVVVMAFSQLEIKSDILEVAFGVLLGAFGLGVAIVLGFGARDVARNMFAGVYTRRQFRAGQAIQLGDFNGTLEEIGSVCSTIRGKDGEVLSVANERFLQDVVTQEAATDDDDDECIPPMLR